MLETVLNLTFQSVDLTKLNQHKKVLYNPAEVTVRVLNHFLTDVIDIIFNFLNITAYYKAVTQQKHFLKKLVLWEFCDIFDVKSLFIYSQKSHW